MSTTGDRAGSPVSSTSTSTSTTGGGKKISKDVTKPKRKGKAKKSGSSPVAPEVYVVEKIVKKVLLEDGNAHYWIKWKGWASVHNTWEPVSNLTGCPELLEKFEKEESLKKKSTSKKVKRDLDNRDNEEGSDEEAYKAVMAKKAKSRGDIMEYGVHHSWPFDRIPDHMTGVYVLQKRLVYIVCCEECGENPDPEEKKERYTPNNIIIIWAEKFRDLFPHIIIEFYEKHVKWAVVQDDENKVAEKAAKAVQEKTNRELEPADNHKENVNPNDEATGDNKGDSTDDDELMDIDEELNDNPKASKDFDRYGLPESMEDSGGSASEEDGYED